MLVENKEVFFSNSDVIFSVLLKYKWNIIGVSETRCIGNGEVTTTNYHKFIYSNFDKKYMESIAFIVNKE